MNKAFEDIITKLDEIYENGRTLDALPFLLDASQRYLEEYGRDIAYASLLSEIGGIYRSFGDYAKSGPVFLEAASIIKSILGEDHPEYATAINNLAGLYRLTGEYEKSGRLFEQTLRIYGDTLGSRDYLYASALNNMALLRNDEGNPAEAVRLQRQALSIIRDIPGCEIEYATSINNIAAPLRALGEFMEAEKLLLEAMEIYAGKAGKKSMLYASALNNLATHYTQTRNFYKAEPLFLSAMEICSENGNQNEYLKVKRNLEGMRSQKELT